MCPDTEHRAVTNQERRDLDVIGRGGPGLAGGTKQRHREPLGGVQLVVVPDGSACHPGGIDRRVQAQALGTSHGSAAREHARRVHAIVAPPGQAVVDRQEQRHCGTVPDRVAVCGHDERQWSDEVRCEPGEGPPLLYELTQFAKGPVLQCADAPVNGFQAVERSGAGKVVALEDSHAQIARGELLRHRQRIDPPTSDNDIELLVGEAPQIAVHR